MAQASLSDQEAMCTNFSFPSHGNKILQGLNKQRLDSSLCDVTITVQGQQYKAHKSVLAAYSPYFHGMFTVNWLSSEGDLVMELDGVTSRAFDSLLKLIYTSVLTVSPTIISEVVSAATYLDMPDVVAVCNQYMEKNVTPRIADAKVYGAGSAGLEVGDSDDDDVGTESAIFANAEDDWTVNLQDISSAARTGEAGMKPAGEETVSKPAKKKRRWKDEHGSFTCETCGKLYTSRASYRTHMYGHRSGKKHTCKAARAKVVKAGIVKVKKKKRRSPTRDPIDGSIKCCTCGAFGTDTGGDRCGSGRCPCYRHYKTCGPKCICKRCINDVPVAKPEQVAPGQRCNCGKNDKKRGNESSSKQRCSMNIRCACFKASRPCGRYCRCVNCGNKGDDSDTTAQGPPNGDASLVKEGLKQPKLFVKPTGKHSVKVAKKGSVADMLEKMRTSGTACEKESSERNAGKESKTSTCTEDQTKRAEKSLPVQISKTAEEQAVIASQDSRNARDRASADAQTVDAAAEVASAVAGIQASQAETVTPSPAGQIPLSSSQIPPAESCSCGKNDKNRGDKSSVQRCSMNVRCACFKAHRSCGLNCRCVNCGNKTDGSFTAAQGPTKGDTSLVKEGLDPKQQVDRNVGKRAAKGSVAEMLEKMRTSGTTHQKEPSKTTDNATEATSAVAGIPSSQAQAESVVRPLPAVRVPLSHPQPPALGGTLKWLCLPDGSLVNPVKVTGTVRFVSSNNAALPSTSGSQPPNNTANTGSQPTQKTSETSEPDNTSGKEQRVDQDARDVENKSPEAGAVSSSDDGHDDENMERGTPTLDQNAETSEGILPSTPEAAAVTACDNDGDVDNARSSIESDKTKSVQGPVTRRTRSVSSTPQISDNNSQQTSKDQSEGNKGPPESLQKSAAKESLPEDHQQSSSSKERPKRREKRVRASAKRPNEGPSQSLQPTIVLKRLRLRSSRVNVNEVETMEENASNETSTPSQSSVGATSVDTRESGDSEQHPSKKRNEGRASKARKRQRKSKPVGKEDAAKEATTKPGPESEADAGTQEAQVDVGTWSSRLRKDRKRTWKSGSGEWITDDSGEELSDDSLEKDYTADSDSSSDEEEVEAVEEEEEEEETEEKRLERRKKLLMKMQRSGPKKVQPNTIGDLLEKGENPNKSLQDIIEEQESKQTRKQRPKTSKSKTRGPRPKKTAAIPVRQLLNLKSSGKEKAPKEIPSWLEEWKKSLSPGTKHTPSGKADRNKTGMEGGGSTSRVSVEPNDQAGSSGPSTQDQVAVPVAPHAGVGDGQSAADQPAAMSTVDSTQIAEAAQQ